MRGLFWRMCWLVFVILPSMTGCVGTQVVFKTIVKPTAGESSGWQEACLEGLFQNMKIGRAHV